MKHLPNFLTLCNLFCGCIAISYILNATPFLSEVNGTQYWISGTTQAYYGAIFIFIAAIFDFFDGMAARVLGVFSPIGKDLDSLADVVSFGVAPSMILMKMLWASWMSQPHAMDISILALAPAFLLACFAALRLATFNQLESNSSYFVGMPVPSVGLLIASFPLINFYNTFGLGNFLNYSWLLYLIIALLCWLMVSKIKFFTIKFSNFSFKENKLQILWIVLSLVSLPFIKVLAIPFSFLLYILLSLFYKPALKN
ncbi:MAG: CDP-alcohol phosphatidyltransferase family protein [Chitinophagaceae bacterium]|nr:CDP-alcohol phosphatidyltransferase family protein [Chitinophagaceae bacterium]